jgi:ABC-type phosphate transport system substrate-binding protein
MLRANRNGLPLIGMTVSLILGVAEANVVTVVSAKSPITALSKTQVADIFLGKSNRYPDGAQAMPIDQPEASIDRGKFYITMTGKSPEQLRAYWAKVLFTGRGQPPPIASSSAELKKLLLTNPLAIGYLDATQVDDSVRVLEVR